MASGRTAFLCWPGSARLPPQQQGWLAVMVHAPSFRLLDHRQPEGVIDRLARSSSATTRHHRQVHADRLAPVQP